MARLTVIGTGIRPVANATHEAVMHAKEASVLAYLVADPLSAEWLKSLNPNHEDLYRFYAVGKQRAATYEQIVNRVLFLTETNDTVCFALYGHPAVFAYPGREAVRRALALGHEARLLPAVSAEDCLFADLAIDPGLSGCQSFEATDFLIRRRVFDKTSTLILWQISVIGVTITPDVAFNRAGLELLCDELMSHYGADHEVIVYEASHLPVCDSIELRLSLRQLRTASLTVLSTLYVPPIASRDPDPLMMERLGLRKIGSKST